MTIEPTFFEMDSDPTRCKALIRSFLCRKIEDAVRSTIVTEPHEQAQAIRWFHDSRIHIGGFHWVCEVLDITPGQAAKIRGVVESGQLPSVAEYAIGRRPRCL